MMVLVACGCCSRSPERIGIRIEYLIAGAAQIIMRPRRSGANAQKFLKNSGRVDSDCVRVRQFMHTFHQLPPCWRNGKFRQGGTIEPRIGSTCQIHQERARHSAARQRQLNRSAPFSASSRAVRARFCKRQHWQRCGRRGRRGWRQGGAGKGCDCGLIRAVSASRHSRAPHGVARD